MHVKARYSQFPFGQLDPKPIRIIPIWPLRLDSSQIGQALWNVKAAEEEAFITYIRVLM